MLKGSRIRAQAQEHKGKGDLVAADDSHDKMA